MNKSLFVEQAVRIGWREPLIESAINICGGFDQFLELVETSSRDIFRRITSIKYNPEMSPSEMSDSSVILYMLSQRLEYDNAAAFYKNNYEAIGEALTKTAAANDYDCHLIALHLAPHIPDDFLLRLSAGQGSDFVEGEQSYKIPAVELCHQVTLYAICLLVYDYYKLRFFGS